MKFVEIERCESAEPWFEESVPSSSEAGKSYTVLVPSNSSTTDEFICECLGFVHQGHCKHQRWVADRLCRWDELIGPEEQEESGVCPRCDGPTVTSLELA